MSFQKLPGNSYPTFEVVSLQKCSGACMPHMPISYQLFSFWICAELLIFKRLCSQCRNAAADVAEQNVGVPEYQISDTRDWHAHEIYVRVAWRNVWVGDGSTTAIKTNAAQKYLRKSKQDSTTLNVTDLASSNKTCRNTKKTFGLLAVKIPAALGPLVYHKTKFHTQLGYTHAIYVRVALACRSA